MFPQKHEKRMEGGKEWTIIIFAPKIPHHFSLRQFSLHVLHPLCLLMCCLPETEHSNTHTAKLKGQRLSLLPVSSVSP